MKSYIIIFKREREIEEKFFNFERDIKQDFIRKKEEKLCPRRGVVGCGSDRHKTSI